MNLVMEWLTAREKPAKRDILLLLIVFGIEFFQSLGHVPLIEPDEGRYAEIPREMLERWDFITPLLNYVKYFEKPPLHYWLNSLFMSIFGENEFAVRFAGALMGLLTVLLVYHVGRRLFGRRSGLLTALILGNCTGFVAQARINITDMTLTCTLSAALAFFIVAARDCEEHKGRYYYLSYVCAALAVLAKGLIGIVFPGAIIFLFLLLTRRWRLLREMRLLSGLLLFFAVAAPWFAVVIMRNPEFAWFFFIHEHFQRFTTTVHGRYQPFWFFIPILLGTMLPWSLFIPVGLRRVWREKAAPGGEERLYLLIWASFIFLFFSKSDSKLVPYILPLFPALALLIGDAFSRALDGEFKPLRVEGFVAGAILSIIGAGLILYPHLAPKPAIGGAAGAVLGVLFMGEGVFSLIAVRKKNAALLFAALCLFSYLLGIFGPHAILPGIAERKSVKDLGLVVREKAPATSVIASFGVAQGFSFYTGRRIVVVGDRNELEFGSRQGVQAEWFIDVQKFRELWDGERTVFVLLTPSEADQLKRTVRTPAIEVAHSRRKVLLTNRQQLQDPRPH